MPLMSPPVVVTVDPLAVPGVNPSHFTRTWLQVVVTGKSTLAPLHVPDVQVPPPAASVLSGGEVASEERVKVADFAGALPFTQKESPWYDEASTHPIQRPSPAPDLVAWLVVARLAAYLLLALPGPAMDMSGEPEFAPSSYS